MTARSPVLYLPIEEKGREFDSKLLIGGAAAERGFSVVIGQVWAMSSSFDRMPPGVVLFKGVNKIQLGNMRFAARHGHLVTAIDEEALGLAHPRFLARDVDPRFPEICDALLAQGQFQARVMHDVVGMAKSKIFVTGNPRTDPLRHPLSESYEADDAILRRKHGRFVVVNSTCGGVNSPWGGLEGYRSVLKQIGWLDPDKPEDEIDYRDHIEHDTLNMEALKTLLKRLPEALPEHNIVLRPHPSERAHLDRVLPGHSPDRGRGRHQCRALYLRRRTADPHGLHDRCRSGDRRSTGRVAGAGRRADTRSVSLQFS